MSLTRILPTTGSGAAYAAKLKEEVEALARYACCPLTSVTGADTITASALYPLDANRAGNKFTFIPAAANTGAVTLNIDGRGALPIKDREGAALGAGRLVAGVPETIENMGTEFRLTGGVSGGSGQTLLRAVFVLQQPKGTPGGTATGNARTRYPFNTTIINEIPGLTLDTSGNIGRFTVPARSFERIEATISFYGTTWTSIHWRDLSGAGADVTSGIARTAFNSHGVATLRGRLSVASSRAMELQYFANAGQTNNGLGVQVNDAGGAAEQFGVIEFQSYG